MLFFFFLTFLVLKLGSEHKHPRTCEPTTYCDYLICFEFCQRFQAEGGSAHRAIRMQYVLGRVTCNYGDKMETRPCWRCICGYETFPGKVALKARASFIILVLITPSFLLNGEPWIFPLEQLAGYSHCCFCLWAGIHLSSLPSCPAGDPNRCLMSCQEKV